ncbi:MAG: hypothetical protein IPM64_06800 [Phycisphaerales bacterium]|nr:hypothetical protein [Phycisphaerales bacterium]
MSNRVGAERRCFGSIVASAGLIAILGFSASPGGPFVSALRAAEPPAPSTQPAAPTPAPAGAAEKPANEKPAATQPATTQPATTQPATTQPATTQPAVTELPQGEIVADKMDLVLPPGFREISLKLQSMLAKRQGWWREYSKAHARTGQPAPYHPNMGVSPDEYDLFLRLSNEVRLEKQSDAVVRITLRDGAYQLASMDGNLLDITGIQVDLARRILKTPVGEITDPEIMAAGADDQARNLGAWEGLRWRLQTGTPDGTNLTFVQFDLGRLVQSDRIYLSMRSNRIESGNVTYKANFTITLPRK